MTLRTVGEEERLLDRRGIRVVVFDHLAIHGAPVSCCCGLKGAGAQLDHLGAVRQVDAICLFSPTKNSNNRLATEKFVLQKGGKALAAKLI